MPVLMFPRRTSTVPFVEGINGTQTTLEINCDGICTDLKKFSPNWLIAASTLAGTEAFAHVSFVSVKHALIIDCSCDPVRTTKPVPPALNVFPWPVIPTTNLP